MRSSSLMKLTPSLANAPKCAMPTIATLTSKLVTSCSAWKPTTALRSWQPICGPIWARLSLAAYSSPWIFLSPMQRTHWGIENGLHYRRDVTLKEDRCRLKIGRAARTMAPLNTLALALILRQGYDYLPQARRRYAARPLEALQLIMQNPHHRLNMP